MHIGRVVILVFGPILIVSSCYWLTMADRAPVSSRSPSIPFHAKAEPRANPSREDARLQNACEQIAANLASYLDSDCQLMIRSPYVLAGDISKRSLENYYLETIVPTAAALSICYFDRRPNHPVTILMFEDEAKYRDHSERLDGGQQTGYYGYYRKAEHRAVLNIATGSGTLAHELTHALADFDFPDMPVWFDEGLASLHEESEFSPDGLQLVGLSNWRLNYLKHPEQRQSLRSLQSLMTEGPFPGENEAVDYAHARYLCLFLQDRGLLSHFYRKLRANVADDPTGLQTLCEIFQTDSTQKIDRMFRSWLAKQ